MALVSRLRRLEGCLLVICAVFVLQFLWISSVLPNKASHPTHLLSMVNGTDKSPSNVRQAPRMTPRQKIAAERERIKADPNWAETHWDPGQGLKNGPMPIKIPTPIFVASLPKSGTTSIWQYFNCGGHQASHQYVKVANGTMLAGECIYLNVQNHRPIFQGCGTTTVFTDTGYAKFRLNNPATPMCYFPSIDALDSLYEHYPSATVILVVRETESWYESMLNHGEGSLLGRMKACNLTGLSSSDGSVHRPSKSMHEHGPDSMELPAPQDVKRFYEWHNARIREFAQARPSLTYIEVSLEGRDTARHLEEATGIPASCWGKCTPLSKFCERVS